MRRQEMARRRRNLSEKRTEEVKVSRLPTRAGLGIPKLEHTHPPEATPFFAITIVQGKNW